MGQDHETLDGGGDAVAPRPDPPRYIDDPHHARQAMRLLMMAVRRGWRIPAELLTSVPEEARRIIEDHEQPESYRLRAMELLARLERDNYDRLAKAAELERGEEARPPGVIQVVYVDRPRPAGIDDGGAPPGAAPSAPPTR